jgi:dTDP-4-amino-4,6-dideoxygalactose transaminase
MIPRSRNYLDLNRTTARLNEDRETEESVSVFEAAFSRYMDAAPLAIATNRARSGLYILLRALDLRPGDEIVLQSFTYWGMGTTIREAGGTPVLVDNSIGDLNTTADRIATGLSDRTKAIIITHLFGVPADIDEIVELGRERGVAVIEDCAQCLGPRYRGRRVGSIGDAAIVSFNFEKHMSTGEGGMLVINDRDLVEPVRRETARYVPLPRHSEMCHVYGLIVQHIATESSLYRPALSSYFGQDLCRSNPATYRAVAGLVESGSSEERIRDVLTPMITERMQAPSSLSERYPLLAPLFRIGFTLLERTRGPQYPRVTVPGLLMGEFQARLGLDALEELDRVNLVRNDHARQLAEAFENHPDYEITGATAPDIDPAFLKYNLLSKSVDSRTIISTAQGQGYELSNLQWPQAMHTFPITASTCKLAEPCSTAASIASRIVNVPVHYYVTDDDLTGMIALLDRVASRAADSRPSTSGTMLPRGRGTL